MIPAFIVLLVIAFALGGYIAFDILNEKKKAAAVDTGNVAENAAEDIINDIAPLPEEQVEPEAYEHGLTYIHAQSGTAFTPSDVREKVTATEVDSLMKDEVAASLIEQSDGKVDKTKQGIINIDTISQYFDSGETVTLDEIKKRVKRFNKQTTYLKVLARGALDKPLTVEADAFSLQAVKMILLTGGKAVKKQ